VRLVIKSASTRTGKPEVRDVGEVRLAGGRAVPDEAALLFLKDLTVYDRQGEVSVQEGERYIQALAAQLRRGTYSGAVIEE
jgi:hypothetical protein